MRNIAKLSSKCKDFLTQTADRLAIRTGFIKRKHKITGCSFVQALVIGNISNSNCSIEGMCQLLLEASITISRRPFKSVGKIKFC